MLLGALTGRDGIGGASVLASAELGEGDEAKRPSVQIGDPFAEKKLLECCLELLDRDLLVSLQDLGAAGLTSSASEMASKGGVGLDIDVAGCRCASPGWSRSRSWSPSPRSGCCASSSPSASARCSRSASTGRRWRRRSASVTDSGRLRVLDGGAVVAELPVPLLVDDCPLYDLEPERPARAAVRPPRPLF